MRIFNLHLYVYLYYVVHMSIFRHEETGDQLRSYSSYVSACCAHDSTVHVMIQDRFSLQVI